MIIMLILAMTSGLELYVVSINNNKNIFLQGNLNSSPFSRFARDPHVTRVLFEEIRITGLTNRFK